MFIEQLEYMAIVIATAATTGVFCYAVWIWTNGK